MSPVCVRRSLATTLITSWLTFGLAAQAYAGPWTPEPGHGYQKIWIKYLFGFSFNAGDGNAYNYGAYHEVFLSTYAEAGLVDDLALVMHAPILRTFHLEDPRDGSYQSHLSPGDPTLSLRWTFLTYERFVAGVEAGVRAPFARAGPVQPVYGTDEGNPVVGQLQLGTGVWDIPLSLSAGYGWDHYYLAGSAGWTLRTDGFDHVLTWSIEGGTTINNEWGMRARVVGYHSVPVTFGEPAPGHESPSGIGNGTNYVGFALEGDWHFSPGYYFGLTVEGGLGALQRQTGGPVITFYFAHRF